MTQSVRPSLICLPLLSFLLFIWPLGTWAVTDQDLFMMSGLDAISHPSRMKLHLTAAATANHVLQSNATVDEKLCIFAEATLRRHRRESQEMTTSTALSAFDFVKDCCDLSSFDTLAHDACFETWPSWSIRVCCAYFSSQGKAHFSTLWKDVAGSILFEEARAVESVEDVEDISDFTKAVVAYHKSGIFMSTELVGNVSPGPLARLVLDTPEEKVFVVQDLEIQNHGIHESPRAGRPVTSPYFQAFIRSFRETTGEKLFLHFANPLKSLKPQLQNLLADDGGGLVLHLVRKPSDMIVSGYRYHHQQRQQGEEWLHFQNPPECLSCDHEAWARIFGRCAFRCTYLQLLRNLSTTEGLQMEYLRSRWDITKMLQNAHAWKGLKNVLQIPMESFQRNFNGTLRCIARFFLQIEVGQDFGPFSTKVETFLDESQIYNTEIQKCCREALERGKSCIGANGMAMSQERIAIVHSHVSSGAEKKVLRQKLKHTDGWKSFISFADTSLDVVLQASQTARTFGCPV